MHRSARSLRRWPRRCLARLRSSVLSRSPSGSWSARQAAPSRDPSAPSRRDGLGRQGRLLKTAPRADPVGSDDRHLWQLSVKRSAMLDRDTAESLAARPALAHHGRSRGRRAPRSRHGSRPSCFAPSRAGRARANLAHSALEALEVRRPMSAQPSSGSTIAGAMSLSRSSSKTKGRLAPWVLLVPSRTSLLPLEEVRA